MHKYLFFLAAMLFYSCSADNEAKAETPTMNKIYITIDGQTQSATLVDNDATRELIAALQDASITVTLNDNDERLGNAGIATTDLLDDDEDSPNLLHGLRAIVRKHIGLSSKTEKKINTMLKTMEHEHFVSYWN